MPRTSTPTHLTPHQAAFVLEKAIADRKLTHADVKHYVASMHEEISSLEAKLARLKAAVMEPVKRLINKVEKKVMGGDMPFPLGKKRKMRVSAKRRASMQLQGQYLGLLTGMTKSARAKFKKVAKTEGRDAAIAAMKKAVGK